MEKFNLEEPQGRQSMILLNYVTTEITVMVQRQMNYVFKNKTTSPPHRY